ncbi:MAG: hypothetical protein ACXWP6_19940 [Ktedonobacterales bacterium]
MRRSVMARVREHPLVALYILLSVSANVAGMWIQLAGKGGPLHVEPRDAALAHSLVGLGLVFLIAVMWLAPLYTRPQTPQVNHAVPEEGGAIPPMRARVMRLPIRWRIVGRVAWGVLLFLTLAEAASAVSGYLEFSYALEYVLGWLNLAGVLGVAAFRVAEPERVC